MGDGSRRESGFNTTVEHSGKRYHVQTQRSSLDAPVIESMVYRGGQILVRLTSSYDDVAARLGFNGDDARHLLQLQHGDLIRKIRHGMLDDDDGAPFEPTGEEAPAVDGDRAGIDPAAIAEPGVQELLQTLGAAIDEALPAANAPQASIEPLPAKAEPPRPWRRWVLCIRLPF